MRIEKRSRKLEAKSATSGAEPSSKRGPAQRGAGRAYHASQDHLPKVERCSARSLMLRPLHAIVITTVRIENEKRSVIAYARAGSGRTNVQMGWVRIPFDPVAAAGGGGGGSAPGALA